MTVNTVQYHRLLGPASLIEAFAEFAALFPIGRADPGNANHVRHARVTGLILSQDPSLKVGQRFYFVI